MNLLAQLGRHLVDTAPQVSGLGPHRLRRRGVVDDRTRLDRQHHQLALNAVVQAAGDAPALEVARLDDAGTRLPQRLLARPQVSQQALAVHGQRDHLGDRPHRRTIGDELRVVVDRTYEPSGDPDLLQSTARIGRRLGHLPVGADVPVGGIQPEVQPQSRVAQGSAQLLGQAGVGADLTQPGRELVHLPHPPERRAQGRSGEEDRDDRDGVELDAGDRAWGQTETRPQHVVGEWHCKPCEDAIPVQRPEHPAQFDVGPANAADEDGDADNGEWDGHDVQLDVMPGPRDVSVVADGPRSAWGVEPLRDPEDDVREPVAHDDRPSPSRLQPPRRERQQDVPDDCGGSARKDVAESRDYSV